ncbi:MAG: xanthine dehydrogenase family protein subunit M, partial [Candidatus Rokubacteria bacterium]|nr:xanthine dehydrogenase family protein subunit M [Candidatus Rokubacteria bacterium]
GVPVRATEAEALLAGKEPSVLALDAAARAVAARLDPSDDLHASATYRREVAEVLARRTLTEAVGRWRRAA